MGDVFARSEHLILRSQAILARARSMRRPLAKARVRAAVSKLCGMLDCSSCSGWTPLNGRGRLVKCSHGCHPEAALSA